ncbi:hypothetical protein B2A_12408 [mine drainage metagenome]|uniref:Uncharacterized protein n=1 Tax=mine drainage metagenome TaxID=410659 RepID=T1A0L5_9ZZZZ
MPGTSPYIIASRVVKGSYVALISAARFHNITSQLPNPILVFSNSYHRPITIKDGYKVRFIKVNKRVIFGFNEYNNAYVSDIEKIFIDDIYYHRSLLYDEELENTITKGILDIDKMKSYVRVLNDGNVNKKLKGALKEFGIDLVV